MSDADDIDNSEHNDSETDQDLHDSASFSVLGKRSRVAITTDRYQSMCYNLIRRYSCRFHARIVVDRASYDPDSQAVCAVRCHTEIGEVCATFQYTQEDAIPASTCLWISILDHLESTLVFDCKPIPDPNGSLVYMESRKFLLTQAALTEVASCLQTDLYNALCIVFASVGIDINDPRAISSRHGWLRHYSDWVAGKEYGDGYETEDSNEIRQNLLLHLRLKRRREQDEEIFQMYFDHVWNPL